MQENYKPLEIEAEVQAQWEQSGVFQASDDENKEKYYCLSMFPILVVNCIWGMYATIPLAM